jgi:hypothetical protein
LAALWETAPLVPHLFVCCGASGFPAKKKNSFAARWFHVVRLVLLHPCMVQVKENMGYNIFIQALSAEQVLCQKL